MAAHTFNSSTQEAEARGVSVSFRPARAQSETLSQKNKQKQNKETNTPLQGESEPRSNTYLSASDSDAVCPAASFPAVMTTLHDGLYPLNLLLVRCFVEATNAAIVTDLRDSDQPSNLAVVNRVLKGQ